MKTKPCLLGIISALLCLSPLAHAATKTWSGGGANNNWNTAANWDAAVAAGDALVFPGTAPSNSLVNTNDFPGSTVFSSLTISGTNYTLRGNQIQLNNGLSGQSDGTNVVNALIQLTADQRFENTAAAGLLVVSNVSLNGRTLTNDTTGRINLSGQISGTGNLVKKGAGTLRLFGSSANVYVGSMTVEDGLLELNKTAGAAAITGALKIGDSTGAIDSAIVRLLGTNQVNDSSAVTIEDDGLLDLNGNSDAIGSLTVTGGDVTTGAGTLTLGGDVTANFSGKTATISGNLSLGSTTRNFSMNGSTVLALTISAVISGNAGVGITKTGSGILRFSGANTYSGVTTLNSAPALQIFNPSALGSTSSGTTLSGGGALYLNGVTVAGETLTNTGISTQLQSDGAAGWLGNVVLNSTLQIAVASGTNDISGAISGAGGLTITQPGTLILSGTNDNTYAGTTAVNTGTLLLNKSPGVMAIPGALVIGDGAGGVNADVVRLQAEQQISDTATIIITNTGLLDSDGFTEVVGALSGTGNLQLDSSVFAVSFPGGEVTFDGIISGSNDLIRIGSGTWILNGPNTFSGSCTVNGPTFVNGTLPANLISVFGTLGGTGTVGRVNMGGNGTISPGLSPGRLTSSNATFIAGSTFRVELNGPTPGSGYDQLKVNGGVTLTNATLNTTLGFPSAISNSFTIIDNDGTEAVTNTFLGLPQGATVNINGTPFRISYTNGTGNDVVLTQLTATQQPLLNIARAATNVVLSWPTIFTGFTLEANTNLNTNVWSAVSPAPSLTGTNNVVTNAVSGSTRFYRLRQ